MQPWLRKLLWVIAGLNGVALFVFAYVALRPAMPEIADAAVEEFAGTPASPPASPLSATPQGPAAPIMLATRIAALGQNFDGEAGIAVRSIDDGWTASFDADRPFPQQSVSKLWVAVTVMGKIDAGELSLDEHVTLTAADLSIFHQPIRKKILASGRYQTTVAELLRYAMTQSDNTANDVLFRRVGGKAGVEGFLASKGLSGITMSEGEKALQMAISGMRWQDSFSYGRNFWAARGRQSDESRAQAIGAYLADPLDGAQPASIAEGLARLANGKLLSPQSSAYLIDLMNQSVTGPKRLRGGLADGWHMAHKTGTGQVLKLLATAYNDVGILTSPSGKKYAVVVMIAATNRPVPERQGLMQAVTRAVIACGADQQDC